jgi:hypothetical protein
VLKLCFRAAATAAAAAAAAAVVVVSCCLLLPLPPALPQSADALPEVFSLLGYAFYLQPLMMPMIREMPEGLTGRSALTSAVHAAMGERAGGGGWGGGRGTLQAVHNFTSCGPPLAGATQPERATGCILLMPFGLVNLIGFVGFISRT